MIHVEPQPEPGDFDAKVRQPGVSALAELLGEPPTIKRPGPRRKRLADRIEDLHQDQLPPLWRQCLPQLAEAYRRICAYSCHYVEPITGNGTVDHYVPKSLDPRRAYEWGNYRFACGRMNARKGHAASVLDPFEVQDGWFQLELVRFQLRAAPDLPIELVARIDDTVRVLGLNDETSKRTRAELCEGYWTGVYPLVYLERRSPARPRAASTGPPVTAAPPKVSFPLRPHPRPRSGPYSAALASKPTHPSEIRLQALRLVLHAAAGRSLGGFHHGSRYSRRRPRCNREDA